MELSNRIKEISDRRNDNHSLVRLLRAGGLQFGVFVVGTTGYYFLGRGDFTLLDAAYMTVITLTTVGYGEVIPIKGDPALEVFTILLLTVGMGAVLYFVSSITAFIVDGELRDLMERRKMNNKIDNMTGHFIIAGMGNTGSHVLPEMLSSKKDVLIIDRDQDAVDRAMEECNESLPFIVGDATADDVLLDAGLNEAAGVIFSLGNDRDNLFATITARQLNPAISIVTRGEDPRSEAKFLRAGATSVIYTNVLGGIRMAAELLRPQVTSFLDIMMKDQGQFRRVEELSIPEKSPVIGQSLRDIGIREHSDALVIAVHETEANEYYFNPGPDFVIPSQATMIVLALVDDVPILEDLFAGDEPWG